MIAAVSPAPAPVAVPHAPVAEVASYGSATAWVDPVRGVVLRRGGEAPRVLGLSAQGLRDLDLGPDADGAPVAVYTRCRPSCDVYAFSLAGDADGTERRVATASAPGVSEHHPTVWRGTLAFERGRAVMVTKLGATATAPARVLMRESGFDDLELGPAALAFSGAYDSEDSDNGETDVHAVPLRRPGGDWYVLDQQVIGEGSSAGFGGLTADARGFTWQRAFAVGCAFPKRVARRGSIADAGHTVDRATAPLAVRLADPAIPATPESEGCEEG